MSANHRREPRSRGKPGEGRPLPIAIHSRINRYKRSARRWLRILAAWCELRQAFRTFRTDRISSAVEGGRYPIRRSILLKRFEESVEQSDTPDGN
jgi:hypothetical protein